MLALAGCCETFQRDTLPNRARPPLKLFFIQNTLFYTKNGDFPCSPVRYSDNLFKLGHSCGGLYRDGATQFHRVSIVKTPHGSYHQDSRKERYLKAIRVQQA